jgi:hypothetical protein
MDGEERGFEEAGVDVSIVTPLKDHRGLSNGVSAQASS